MVYVCLFRLLCVSACFIQTAASEELVLHPSRLVVEYGANASAKCFTNLTEGGMGWEVSQGPVDMTDNVQNLTWTVPHVTEWDIKPLCFFTLLNGTQYTRHLDVVVYKLPDALFFSNNCQVPITEGQTCSLHCDIQSVAPVQYLKVVWYKGNIIMEKVSFKENTTSPVNKSVSLVIQPSRNDDGAFYRCEAKLELGPEGPQHPPTGTSKSLSITVHYKPVVSDDIEVLEIRGKEIILNCSATAKPPAEYTWDRLGNKNEPTGGLYPISYPGNYTCTASNIHGKAKKLFVVEFKYETPLLFWIIVALGLLLAAVLITGYTVKNRKTLCKKTSSTADQNEEDKEFL